MFKSYLVEYYDGETQLEGYCAYNDKNTDKKPVVLVCHDWSGRNDFACHKADQLAELGYIGFAMDIYGKGKRGQTKEEKMALMQPFVEDRTQLKKRLLAAVDIARKLSGADTERMGAIGFCFGGLCVLDLARSGADIKGVVSFHGLLHAPENTSYQHINAKILVLHGYSDPMVPPDQVIAFANEMTAAKSDWQIDIYGNTMHAFTVPQANDPGFGTVYNKHADERSWIAMKAFFKEIF